AETTSEATAEASATEAMTATAGGAEGAIGVDLTDAWEVNPSADSTAAGSVTFTANNTGVQPHELVVVKTDLGPTELPVEGGVVAEEGEGYEIVGKTEQIPGGGNADLTVDLEAGAYLLICNVPGHYQLGMTTAFTVN
ncbi:MAG: plastocyanin/azurin family copper-binding protein, partial [Dehalococcoidia bacterium]